MKPPPTPRAPRWLDWLARIRILKFGAVGLSGTLVNLAVLYVGREHLFARVTDDRTRLNLSLALAIFCATANNFCWNRNWTWADRQGGLDRIILLQFGRYALACWLGILLQTVFTNLLVAHLHYLAANVLAIGSAGVFNFVVNDWWTFRSARPRPALPGLVGAAPPLDPGEPAEAPAHEGS